MEATVLLVMALTLSAVGASRPYPQNQDPDRDWICPTILVDCSESASGQIIKFKATVYVGVPPTKPTFRWRVSNGRIINGQGTESITVKVAKSKKRSVRATVQVLGTPKDCPNQASCSTTVTSR